MEQRHSVRGGSHTIFYHCENSGIGTKLGTLVFFPSPRLIIFRTNSVAAEVLNDGGMFRGPVGSLLEIQAGR